MRAAAPRSVRRRVVTRSVATAIILAIASAAVAPAVAAGGQFGPRRSTDGDPLTSNPRAYRAYLRKAIREDIAKLGEISADLVDALDPGEGRDLASASRHADQITRLSRRAWTNLQYGEATRRNRADQAKVAARDVEAAVADAALLRRLVARVDEAVRDQQRARTLNAGEQVETLEMLEQIEGAARRIKRVLDRRR
jgi:hypothetical protein